MEQVRPLDPTVHHRNNPKKSIPAKSRVHQVPLDDTLIATADDFLLLELVSPVELELEAELVAEGLPETVTCPETSEKRVHNEPISRQSMAKTVKCGLLKTLTLLEGR
jgi:hypothetical protein